MSITRKLVRDAIRTTMETNFNGKMQDLAGLYGIVPFSIDWVPGSRNLFQGFLDAETVDISQFVDYPAVAIYTSSSFSETGDPNRQKFHKFSGTIVAHIDFYLKFKEGIEIDVTESTGDAVEDACVEVLTEPLAVWPNQVAWNGDFRCDREPVRLLGDGWEQRIPFTLIFGVHSS